MNIHHPVVQSVLAPLLVMLAWAVVAVLARRPRVAGVGVGVALLVSLLLLAGLPQWPLASAVQKFVVVVALLLLAGVAGTVAGRRTRTFPVVAVLLPAALAWLLWPRTGTPAPGDLVLLVGLTAAGLFCCWRMNRVAVQPLTPPLMCALLAGGLALLGFAGGSLVLMQAAMALAVASGGFAVLGAVASSLALGRGALMIAVVSLAGLAALVVRLTAVPPWALLPLLAVLVCDAPARRLPAPAGRPGQLLRGVYLALLACVPLAAAVALAWSAREVPDLYYQ